MKVSDRADYKKKTKKKNSHWIMQIFLSIIE